MVTATFVGGVPEQAGDVYSSAPISGKEPLLACPSISVLTAAMGAPKLSNKALLIGGKCKSVIDVNTGVTVVEFKLPPKPNLMAAKSDLAKLIKPRFGPVLK